MTIKQIGALLLLCGSLVTPSMAETREIALTIDDLPFVGTNDNRPGNLQRAHDRFMRILDTLNEEKIPATGFVIGGAIAKGQWELLQQFHDQGYGIGNHTYTHSNANRIPTPKYLDEIAHADKVLTPILTTPKYFRFPYLAEGRGASKKQIADYLAENNYVVAPVTIDTKDYEFNERLLRINWRIRDQHIARIKQQYLTYVWNQTLKAEKRAKSNPVKQILLVHANLLESQALGDLIDMYKRNGYVFISLTDALKNPAKPIIFSESSIVDAAKEASRHPNPTVLAPEEKVATVN